MKIQLSKLRRIIRETLEEEAIVPGTWMGPHGDEMTHKDKARLGNRGFLVPDLDEEVDEEVSHVHLDEIRQFVSLCLESPAGPGVAADPTDVKGFYPYEVERGVDIHGFWYRSPGRSMGGDGDPGRPSDAAEYVGFKTKGVTPEDAAAEAAPPPNTQK